MTSATAAASKPASRLSRYISEPWISSMRARRASGRRCRRSFRAAISSDRTETSMPTIRSKPTSEL